MSRFIMIFWPERSGLEPAERQIELSKALRSARRNTGWVRTEALQFKVDTIDSALAIFFGDMLGAKPDRVLFSYPVDGESEVYYSEICNLIITADDDNLVLRSDGTVLGLRHGENTWLSETENEWKESAWLATAPLHYSNLRPEYARQDELQSMIRG